MGIRGITLGLSGGWYYQQINVGYAVFRPDQQPLPPQTFVSRGGSPNYGSGPYFKAQGSMTVYIEQSMDPIAPSSQILYSGNKTGVFKVVNEGACYTVYHTTYIDDVLDDGYKVEYYFKWDSAYPFYADMVYYNYVKATESWHESFRIPGFISGDGTLMVVEYNPPADYSSMYNEFLMAVEANYFPNHLENIYASLYMDACSAIPQSSVNQMANVSDVFSYFKYISRLIKDPASTLKSLLKDLSDPRKAWLAYRYTYSTTNSDIRDVSRVIAGMRYLSQLENKEARYHASTNDGDIVRRASVGIKASTLLPTDAISIIKKLGGVPSLSDVWDMIPYSFIADWFIQLGSILETWDQWDGIVRLQPNHIWFSASRELSSGGFVYYRVPGHVPTVPPLYRYHSVSGQTWAMRIADTIALFT